MYELPLIEKLNCSNQLAQLLSSPNAIKHAEMHAGLAQDVCNYLQSNSNPKSYFAAIRVLLGENPRLALYVPLEELSLESPADFRASYHRAWRECWNSEELRSDYTQGDISPQASVREGQKIIKAFHLIPWLLRSGIICPLEIEEIIEKYHDNPAAMQALGDCVSVFRDTDFFNEDRLGHCSNALLEQISALRPELTLDYKQEDIEEEQNDIWSLKRTVMRSSNRGIFRNITGPFSENISEIEPKLQIIEQEMGAHDIFLVGGARFKGYTTYNSDFDAYAYDSQSGIIIDLRPGSTLQTQVPQPSTAHRCFNTLWVGKDAPYVQQAQQECLQQYQMLDDEAHAQALYALEDDLLKRYLMHKGFPYSKRHLSLESSRHADIDGDSAFYDRSYRSAATQLFAKYIYIPKI